MSSSKIIVDRFTALSQIIGRGILYNINYLPDTVLGGISLFALLLQSGPLAILAISLFSVEFLHNGLTTFAGATIPGLKSTSNDVDRCSGHFPGISFERLTQAIVTNGTLKSLSIGFPSFYILFFGVLFGYMMGMSNTYARELEALPQKRAGIYFGLIIMGLLSLLFVIYRIMSGCDSIISVVVAAFLGVAYGYYLEQIIAYNSDRKLTNLMNVPILRDRAVDGKPIYVCKKE